MMLLNYMIVQCVIIMNFYLDIDLIKQRKKKLKFGISLKRIYYNTYIMSEIYNIHVRCNAEKASAKSMSTR